MFPLPSSAHTEYPSCGEVLGRQSWRRGAKRPRRVVAGPRRVRQLLLAVAVFASSAIAPAIGGDPLDDRFGAGSTASGGEPSRASTLRGDLTRAAGRSSWAAHHARSPASDSLRTARRTGPTNPQRPARLGAPSARAPRLPEVSRLVRPDEGRVDALVASLGSAPRGPPAA